MPNVTINKWTGDITTARNLMDDEICESIQELMPTDAPEQVFVNAYMTAHFAKYGTEFVVN